ncbi:MAG: family 20 glycosylhydrolase [Polyangiaceae bacterium]
MAQRDGADSTQSLLPRPRSLQRLGGAWSVPPTVKFICPDKVSATPALARLERALRARGHHVECTSELDRTAQIHLRIAPLNLPAPLPEAIRAQAYGAEIAHDGAHLSAENAVGAAYALTTLAQLVELSDEPSEPCELPCLSIRDWPDFPVRGVMLDISRDKVPTLATLEGLVDRLAYWKVNQLQLYMEHTFAYLRHEVVWRDASALTADEVRRFDAYCAARNIELVPNQNSFGHMHRWLVHEPYRQLAECPDGFAHPWNWKGEPYGLCVTDPATLTFLEGLYDELLPNFQSRTFNVGLDEPLDLGCGRSKSLCDAHGAGRLYVDFLKAVHARVKSRGRTMAFWADTITSHPELIAEVPKDAIGLEWGYEASHPFAANLAALRSAGLTCYACPGTSSWNSFAGRTHNAVENIAKAAREGQASGAEGLLITDWGDHGHLQPLSVSYAGFILGAAFGWNAADAERPFELDLPKLLDVHAFSDPASVLGRIAYDLGDAYRQSGSLRANSSVLFWSVIKPERLFSPDGVTRETLEATLTYVDRVSASLPRARPSTAEGALAAEELSYARDLLRFACRLGIARSSLADPTALTLLSRAKRDELSSALDAIIARHGALWAARNRPGGRLDSVAHLTRLLDELRS